MSDAEHDVALEDTDRIHGRTALVRNVAAAISLSNAVRSTPVSYTHLTLPTKA